MNEYVNNVINLSFRVVPITESEIDYMKSGYTEENKKELLHIARKKKVLPVVGKFMCSQDVDKEEWDKHYQHFLNRNRQVIDQIDELFAHFKSKGITRIAAYENFGALLISDTDIALYSSGDVDLFADIAFKRQIIDAMVELGYLPTKDINHKRNLMTEFLKEGAVIRVNVDWKVLRRYSLPVEVDTEEVVKWDSLVLYKDTNIKLLSKEALLYLCFIRIAIHGYSRSPDVRLYIDTYNVVCAKPDWNIVLEWAKRDKVLTKFVTVAYIANRLNGVEIPESVLVLAEQDKYVQRIIDIAYDEGKRSLKYDPSGLELLKLEAASDRNIVAKELLLIAFPPREWLKKFYLAEGEKPTRMYLNYYKRFLRR